HLSANQLGRQCRQSIILVFGPAVFDRDVLGLDITALLQSLAECAHRPGEPVKRLEVQKPDHRHRGLLRAGRERPPDRRAAEKRYKRASLHSITSSARASSVAGIVMPKLFAVCRLMTNSNFVGSWTGISAGFSPLRMRPA